MRSLQGGGDSSVSMSLSAESARLRLSHMRTQLAWACFLQGTMFRPHLMMPCTFLLALLACMSLHRRDASPRTHHPQTEHKQQHAHASCLVVLHVNRWQRKALRHGPYFFVAGMIPYLDMLGKTLRLEGMPVVILMSSVMAAILFFLFGVTGCTFIVGILMVMHEGTPTVQRWLRLQN
jgi:hypothetical protein